MNRTRIKICGITTLRDAENAVALGVDALGFNLFEQSPRFIDPDKAAEIVRQLPPYVTSVALMVNEAAKNVSQLFRHTGVDLVQFHGDETPVFCDSAGVPYIRAIRVIDPVGLPERVGAYRASRGVLLDTYVEGIYGGTGVPMDTTALPPLPVPVVLAGGLNPGNVGAVIRHLRPFAVDVSGGVEAAKGVKDKVLMQRFVEAVRAATEELEP